MTHFTIHLGYRCFRETGPRSILTLGQPWRSGPLYCINTGQRQPSPDMVEHLCRPEAMHMCVCVCVRLCDDAGVCQRILNAFLCMFVCLSACTYVCVCQCVRVSKFVGLCMVMCTFLCKYPCVCVSVYLCACVYA